MFLQVDIIFSLLSGRLVREKVGPAVQSAVQSQVAPQPHLENHGAPCFIKSHYLKIALFSVINHSN
jgi:hypothetical protein